MNEFTDKKTILKLAYILLFVVFALTAIYFGLRSFSVSHTAPQDFKDVQASVAGISQDIVRLSNETNIKIKELSELDARGKRERGRALIDEARAKNKESYEKAVILSKELEKLAKSLNTLQNPDAERLMYQGVSIQISLVTEFIQYSKDLNTFLETVEVGLINDTPENRFRITADEQQVNARIATINQLNETFQQNATAFEKIMK